MGFFPLFITPRIQSYLMFALTERIPSFLGDANFYSQKNFLNIIYSLVIFEIINWDVLGSQRFVFS